VSESLKIRYGLEIKNKDMSPQRFAVSKSKDRKKEFMNEVCLDHAILTKKTKNQIHVLKNQINEPNILIKGITDRYEFSKEY